ncbi:MAG: 5-formyltetrahydrofolate cyclo-ligase [Candidatus Aerophobetes bacterium]|nr:5-formyltetrahydrofolate cyclo-ligase [Candidatus Aerophobetes bacterium]
MPIWSEKALLRKRILSLRRSLSYEETGRKSDKVKERLFGLSVFYEARVILFYLSLPDEVQTQQMIKVALKLNKIVGVPLVKLKERDILPVELKSFNEGLTVGPLGIPQPEEGRYQPLSLNKIDLVIIPGIVFDARGNRIGFGMGFYDRFLKRISSRARAVALAFELQLVSTIPSQLHDIQVDYIITEKRVIKCKRI